MQPPTELQDPDKGLSWETGLSLLSWKSRKGIISPPSRGQEEGLRLEAKIAGAFCFHKDGNTGVSCGPLSVRSIQRGWHECFRCARGN